MLTIQKVRDDLRDIRYYFSKQKLFDDVSKTVVRNSVRDTVERYNQAVKDAPARLFDLYISLYVHNNSQSALADDWNFSDAYIRLLNQKLCEFLLKALSAS